MEINNLASAPPLNDEQMAAVTAIQDWLANPTGDSFYTLSGFAGTGKTFTVRYICKLVRGKIVLTAPTNKATKVLRETFTLDDYKPECRTIYSLLGLQLSAQGEIKELKEPDDPIDLSDYKLVIVDEGSMISTRVMRYIERAAYDHKLKFLFMGDPAQLPPVGEQTSPIWQFPSKSQLERVMRYDNQLLKLATSIRQVVDAPFPKVNLQADNDGSEGVWKYDGKYFRAAIASTAHAGHFATPGHSKVIAWRNVTVDTYNKLVRQVMFEGTTEQFVVGDRVIFTEPARDFADEPIAATDDEGTITRVIVEQHPLHEEFKVYRLSIQIDGGRLVAAYKLHPDSQEAYSAKVEQLAAEARFAKHKWKDFWGFKEAFHQVRHAYAITAHRAQGSTYQQVFVDYKDILLNRTRHEAFRCLYVACTRASKRLVLGGL